MVQFSPSGFLVSSSHGANRAYWNMGPNVKNNINISVSNGGYDYNSSIMPYSSYGMYGYGYGMPYMDSDMYNLAKTAIIAGGVAEIATSEGGKTVLGALGKGLAWAGKGLWAVTKAAGNFLWNCITAPIKWIFGGSKTSSTADETQTTTNTTITKDQAGNNSASNTNTATTTTTTATAATATNTAATTASKNDDDCGCDRNYTVTYANGIRTFTYKSGNIKTLKLYDDGHSEQTNTDGTFDEYDKCGRHIKTTSPKDAQGNYTVTEYDQEGTKRTKITKYNSSGQPTHIKEFDKDGITITRDEAITTQ